LGEAKGRYRARVPEKRIVAAMAGPANLAAIQKIQSPFLRQKEAASRTGTVVSPPVTMLGISWD